MTGPDTAGAHPPRWLGPLQRRPVALIWVGVLLYSCGPVMVRASDVSGPVLSFWRLVIGALVMGVATGVHVAVSGRVPTRTGWGWAARGGVVFGLHQLLFMTAIKATSVVDVTLMQVLSPMFVAVLAVPLFGERPGAAFRLWSLVAVAGASVVVLAGSAGPEGNLAGMALAVGNVAFFAVYFVWSKQGRDHIDVVPFLFGVVVVAGLTVGLYGMAAGEALGTIGRGDLVLAAAIAVGPGALGHFVSTWPLRVLPANVPPVIQLTMPFLAGVLAWVLLGEGIGLLHVAGGAVTIAGVAGAVLAHGGPSPAGPRAGRDGQNRVVEGGST